LKNEGGGDVYLTSKITGKEHGIKTRAAVEESIERLPRGMKWVSELAEGYEGRLMSVW
jgi:hypothetical protein